MRINTDQLDAMVNSTDVEKPKVKRKKKEDQIDIEDSIEDIQEEVEVEVEDGSFGRPFLVANGMLTGTLQPMMSDSHF